MIPGLVGPHEWHLSDLISFYVVIKLTLILTSYGYMNVVLSTCKMYKAIYPISDWFCICSFEYSKHLRQSYAHRMLLLVLYDTILL
jgi:hypothetical protein